MKRDFNLNVYGNKELKAKFEHVKESYQARDPSIPLSDSAAGAKMIDDTYQKILGKETNANRITTIIERLDKLEAVVMRLTELIERMEGDGR